jgi:hypothetical protein
MAQSDEVDAAVRRFRDAGQLLASRITSRISARDKFLEAYSALEQFAIEQYSQVPINLDELVLKILPELFELFITSGADIGDLEAIFNDLISGYQLDIRDLSYYRRDKDPVSFYQDFGLTKIDALKPDVTRKLCHAFVEAHLLHGDVKRFCQHLECFRRTLPPEALMQAIFRLATGLNIGPSPAILSVIFGERIDSRGERSRGTAYISLDTFLKQCLQEFGLQFTTEGLLILLEQFFERLDQNRPGEILDLIKTQAEQSDGPSCMTGRLFSYSGWAGGIPVPADSYLAKLPVRYPRNSYANVIAEIARTIDLNKALRNFTRDSLGLPKVGEGKWVSELSVLRFIEGLVTLPVIHQWAPAWLLPQRIDVGIPDLLLAFEYQGKQHYQPIDFFGGEEAFHKLQKLDERKRQLCAANCVTLVELDYRWSESKWKEHIREEVSQARIKCGAYDR